VLIRENKIVILLLHRSHCLTVEVTLTTRVWSGYQDGGHYEMAQTAWKPKSKIAIQYTYYSVYI